MIVDRGKILDFFLILVNLDVRHARIYENNKCIWEYKFNSQYVNLYKSSIIF
jgi:hypothetical protein